MASWGTVIAFSGFNYSGVTGKFSITSRPGNYFWSNGYSWGNVEVKDKKIIISVHYGTLRLKKIEMKQTGVIELKEPIVLKDGDSKEFMIQ